MLHLVICDDEPAQLSLLETYVREWARCGRLEIEIAFCQSAEQFLFHWEENQKADIVLLDIDMPGMNGMTLAKGLRDKGEAVQIIFVTGLADYVLEGYEVEAVSYLIKPVRKEKLFACLGKARNRREKEEPSLLLLTAGGAARVRLRDVCYLESVAHDTWVHCASDTEGVRCRVGIHQLEQQLGEHSGGFFKIHRSYLVNLAFVSRINRREVVMDTGEALPVARGRWEALNQTYLNYYRRRHE